MASKLKEHGWKVFGMVGLILLGMTRMNVLDMARPNLLGTTKRLRNTIGKIVLGIVRKLRSMTCKLVDVTVGPLSFMAKVL